MWFNPINVQRNNVTVWVVLYLHLEKHNCSSQSWLMHHSWYTAWGLWAMKGPFSIICTWQMSSSGNRICCSNAVLPRGLFRTIFPIPWAWKESRKHSARREKREGEDKAAAGRRKGDVGERLLCKLRALSADNTSNLSGLTVVQTNEHIFFCLTLKFRVGGPRWCIFNVSFQNKLMLTSEVTKQLLQVLPSSSCSRQEEGETVPEISILFFRKASCPRSPPSDPPRAEIKDISLAITVLLDRSMKKNAGIKGIWWQAWLWHPWVFLKQHFSIQWRASSVSRGSCGSSDRKIMCSGVWHQQDAAVAEGPSPL